MRFEEFAEHTFGVKPRRAARAGSRHPRGHTPVPRYHTQPANPEEQLDELSFLGSQCTKDCSGHRAGYNWSQRKGLVHAASWSPSFNKGAALAVAGN